MWKKLLIFSVVLTICFSGTAMARDNEVYQQLKNMQVDSFLLSEGQNSSTDVVYGAARSTALATAIGSITNEGGGVIGVFAETTMHIPVDWAYLTIYLERWYEEQQTWQTVKTYEREFLPEDEADGELTTATLSVSVVGQPTGYYYRVRALHELEFDNGWYEAKVTKTDGILITSTP